MTPRAESPGESWVRLEIIDNLFPPPVLQWSVRRDGRELFLLDLAYPGLKIAIEYDGEEFHDSELALRGRREAAWLACVIMAGS